MWIGGRFIGGERGRFFNLDFDLTVPQSKFWHLPEKDTAIKYPLFVGGYGSGKSYVAITAAIRDVIGFPGANIGIYAPTHDLLKLNLWERFIETLEGLGIPFTENKVDRILDLGFGKLIFRSMSNPERIISYEVFRSHVDEIDTLTPDKARQVWNRIIARNRQKVPNTTAPNMVSAYTTPEGFGFTYDRWKKQKSDRYAYITAPTSSNPHLRDDYEKDLRDTYTDQQIIAYIGGGWANLTSGSVYPDFDRKLNGTTYLAAPRETLHVGMDFNVLQGAAVIHVIRDGLPYAVGEIVESRDTLTTCDTLRESYPDHPIIVYPDASGKHRTTQNVTESDLQRIRDAGFGVDMANENPPIKDRVAAMNAMFHNANGVRRYKVNEEKCPNYVLALEQQSYKNGVPDKTTGMDHVVDAAGYFIHRKYPIERKVSEMRQIKGY